MNYKLLFATIFSVSIAAVQATEQSQATQKQSSVLCSQCKQCNRSTVCNRCTWEEEIARLELQKAVIDLIIAKQEPEGDAKVISTAIGGFIVAFSIATAFIAGVNHFAKTDNSLYLAAMALLPIHLLDTWVRLKTDLNTGTPKEFLLALKQEKSELEDKITIYKQAIAATAIQPMEAQPTETQA